MNDGEMILVDKPAGISSFGVVAKVRGYLRAQCGHKVKVGHTGTLDPFATGLLILLAGKYTKRSDEFLKKDKVYEATMRLGQISTTGDPEGEITKCSDKVVSEAEIVATMQRFVGTLTQRVPRYSAVKIDGRRAYDLARAGKDFETPTREVTIYSIEVMEIDYPEVKFRCHVSSGTYIRTLAEDIGAALGVGAYLTALRRTAIGDWSVEAARPLSDFTGEVAPKASDERGAGEA